MNHPSKLLIALLLLSTTFITPGFTQGYQLTGTFGGLPDSTWLYLGTQQAIDSCQLTHGTFHMRGRIPQRAVQVYLHTKNFTHYVPFWLENSRIRMAVEAGPSRKGIITSLTGSATETENKQWILSRTPIDRSIDSLNRILISIQDTETRKNLQFQLQYLNAQSQ